MNTEKKKVTFAKLGHYGRLGNQLFQIASTMGIAHQNGMEAVLPPWEYSKYFPNYKAGMDAKQHTQALNEWTEVMEAMFNHYDATLDKGKDLSLAGYFQSEKYFINVRDQIKHIFSIRENKPSNKFCAIHVRRGDYVDNPNYYQVQLSYYKKAIRYIKQHVPDVEFKVHSDDIAWCKTNLPGLSYSEGLTDIQDLHSMAQCTHFICANSSFSWWAAFAGERKGSIIIFPEHWFAGDFAEKNNDKDVTPSRWHRGVPAVNKYDLTDVTFNIPVMYDHEDRKKNLDLCICYLNTHFNTNIIVAEWGDKRFEYVKQFGVKYAWYGDSAGKPFHRTKMLNDMCMDSKTPFIFNYDADVFFDPEQIVACIEKLRKNNASACYPYDGRFFRVDRIHFKKLESTLDVSTLALLTYPEKSHTEISYGGAIAWNKDKFIIAGMENQKMISFGPEDYERYERANRLGLAVSRVAGPLYHMDHYVGTDSTNTNPHFKENWKEYEFIKNLPEDRLKQYIDDWPWRKEPIKTIRNNNTDPRTTYNEKFYAEINEASMISADIILPMLKEFVEFDTVLDVGCGQGAWGVSLPNDKYFGVDGDYIKPEHLLIDEKQFFSKDVSKKFNLRKKFDLVISLEVGEHIPEGRADAFLDNICLHGDLVLFSAAIPYQGGNNHLNEQWPSWWAKKFMERGFYPHDLIRSKIWEDKRVPYYYRQNTIVYSKNPINGPENPVLDMVHPDKYLQLVK